MAFRNDLNYGKQGEELVKTLLGGFSFNSWKPVLKLYDFYHFDSNTYYEVKRDRMAPLTKNIAVELEYKGISSIHSSIADYFVYIISNEAWQIKTEKLIAATEGVKIVFGGDNKNSKLALIKLDEFKKIATKLTIS